MTQPEYVFDVEDWKGRSVHLTRRTYDRHLPIHPEIRDYLAEAMETIGDPDIVLQTDGGAERLCRFGLGRGSLARTWLAAVIYYQGDVGVLATFHFMRNLPDETVLERRAIYINGRRFPLPTEG